MNDAGDGDGEVEDLADLVTGWPVDRVAAGVTSKAGTMAATGPVDEPFDLASVTKLFTAYAVLIAVEEGTIGLDDPAGPPGSTVRHLLAHASGLPFEAGPSIGRVGARRIYSNLGFDELGSLVEERAGMPFAEYLREAVARPLGLTALRLTGSPGAGAVASLTDLLALGRELMAPTLVSESTLAEAAAVAFPGLSGVVPGFGRQDPNDWGLGFERRDRKSPHWTGSRNSEETFGHFGRSGTFLWVDPDIELACAALTDREFDTWAIEAWPVFSDAVIARYGPQTPT